MFAIRTARAHPRLRQVATSFVERRGRSERFAIIRPLHARPDLFCEFYFREPYRGGTVGGAFDEAPPSVLVGPTTRPGAILGVAGEVENFTIRFTPTGLSRLFGVPMGLVVDRAVAPSDLSARRFAALENRLRGAPTFEARVALAEKWIAEMLDHARPHGAADHAARLIARARGRVSMDGLAAHTGLSSRQMQRRFIEDVGMTPKLYARLHRFTAAIEMRQAAPCRSWADIALASGFSDQAHLANECRRLADLTPNSLLAALAGGGASDFYNP